MTNLDDARDLAGSDRIRSAPEYLRALLQVAIAAHDLHLAGVGASCPPPAAPGPAPEAPASAPPPTRRKARKAD